MNGGQEEVTRNTDAVEKEVRIAARPETIFPFFTDPEQMVRWKGTSATLDPTPGGTYRVSVTGRDVVKGKYDSLVKSLCRSN